MPRRRRWTTPAPRAPHDLRASVDVVASTRQFDESTPVSSPPLGGSDNLPRSVADRAGLDPREAIYEVAGGQSPQKLLTELAARIAAGEARAALLVGGEAISTVLDLAALPASDRPDLTERRGGQLDDRGFGLDPDMVSDYQVGHGLLDAATHYAMFDNARRSRLGIDRVTYAHRMGELFEPFTRVAAANPHAAVATRRTVEELITPTDDNRMVLDPYPKHLMSREKVNQGASVLLCARGTARELGVPEDRWVYLHGHADLREQPLLKRADLGASPAATSAVRAAVTMAGIELDDLATLDLYSCFPIAVSVVADELRLASDDPRGLTLTGGLPFFGGPGNSYSAHAIAETVVRARAASGTFGLVGANGGTLSKYSTGVYSTTPAHWRDDDDESLQGAIDALPEVEVVEDPGAEGAWARVETWTVRHSRSRRRSAVVVGRLDDERRFLANVEADDDEMVDLLLGDDAPGARVLVRRHGSTNLVTRREPRR